MAPATTPLTPEIATQLADHEARLRDLDGTHIATQLADHKARLDAMDGPRGAIQSIEGKLDKLMFGTIATLLTAMSGLIALLATMITRHA